MCLSLLITEGRKTFVANAIEGARLATKWLQPTFVTTISPSR